MSGHERSELTPGQEIGRYRVLVSIGRGGMGEVYRAHDSRLGRPVALKVITGEQASDPRARRRFLAEADMAARVVHPYVATVFDVIDREESPILVMECVEGRRFDEVLADGPLDPGRAARYGAEIAEALAAIHQAGIVHRDLKPGNVMITERGQVKVMDFGVAQNAIPFARTAAPRLTRRARESRRGPPRSPG